ncbi:hypothetical protein FOZ60_010821 [Perkinsus olseni]|uniref:RRM domain-containing protein n=1 Tax=Perkinsus olseni TaxID=32597 RepID=A0A7J6NEI6_PEROL|nr:hypothetical protein FOZ60_010821 [Perkinsus olseni]
MVTPTSSNRRGRRSRSRSIDSNSSRGSHGMVIMKKKKNRDYDGVDDGDDDGMKAAAAAVSNTRRSADVGHHHHHHHQSTSTTTTTTLHVSNLTRNINEDHLYEIFGTFAEVVDVDLAIDDKVNLPKGYAHIILPNREAAKDAIYHLDHAQIDGNVINIRFAHNSGGGGGGGDKTRDHRDDEGSIRVGIIYFIIRNVDTIIMVIEIMMLILKVPNVIVGVDLTMMMRMMIVRGGGGDQEALRYTEATTTTTTTTTT